MHDIFVLVNERTHAGGSPLVLVLNDVEAIATVSIDGGCKHEFVELTLRHGINLRVDVELNFKAIDLAAGRDARY